MPETMTQTETATNGTASVTVTEPAPATGASASKQETTGSAGTTTAPAPAATPKPGELPDDWEWNGNVDEVEQPFRKRAQGIQRYLTRRSQELADAQRKAEELDRIKNDPNIQNYLNGQRQTNAAAPAEQPLVSPQVWEQLGVDPAIGNVIDRIVESRISAARNEVGGVLSEINQKQAKLEKMQEIQDFGEIHPDMWELYDAGILGPIVREVVDTKKGTLTDAYNMAKGIREKFRTEAIQKSQERVQQKKAAFSSPPSASNETDTVWVDNPQDSYRVAFEAALNGKRVNVKTRPRP